MSAYATALLESPKEFVIEEALKNHDEVVKLKKEIEQLKLTTCSLQIKNDLMQERDEANSRRDREIVLRKALEAQREKISKWANYPIDNPTARAEEKFGFLTARAAVREMLKTFI